ncbi:group III truncated hemoglobin [Hoeflea alexandrii]|uniref:group III truncated hemoglobin n=1 Tax=Hoeflea alexandrii TaxID=288436 RepID=UPI0022AEF189|nr:group III truncated hemoglobin [Hoeflea alexandrii]MCZ4288103.1 group III truncated hemoglobin [Hoeflea alexandrii]
MADKPAPIVITARAGQPRTPAVEISPREIGLLVDRFYGDIRAHPRLGPLFEERLAGKWDVHLDRMNRFWRSVLLHSGEYSGQPVVKHNALPDLEEDDFRLWLDLFEQTTATLFAPPTAAPIVVIARRIARSLWLARFGTPFSQTPTWLA